MYMQYALNIYAAFFEGAPSVQKSTSQSMEFLAWFSFSGFSSSAAIWTCSVVAVKKLGYKAEDIDIRQPVFLGFINGLIISLLIVRQCQQRCGKLILCCSNSYATTALISF